MKKREEKRRRRKREARKIYILEKAIFTKVTILSFLIFSLSFPVYFKCLSATETLESFTKKRKAEHGNRKFRFKEWSLRTWNVFISRTETSFFLTLLLCFALFHFLFSFSFFYTVFFLSNLKNMKIEGFK